MFIPKTCDPGSNMRVLTVSGLPEQIDMAKNEIEEIVNMVFIFSIKFICFINYPNKN